jgi:hypothetical protein
VSYQHQKLRVIIEILDKRLAVSRAFNVLVTIGAVAICPKSKSTSAAVELIEIPTGSTKPAQEAASYCSALESPASSSRLRKMLRKNSLGSSTKWICQAQVFPLAAPLPKLAKAAKQIPVSNGIAFFDQFLSLLIGISIGKSRLACFLLVAVSYEIKRAALNKALCPNASILTAVL